MRGFNPFIAAAQAFMSRAAGLATGKTGGVPLPTLSRSTRNKLKRVQRRNGTTYFPPSKRNGARERSRRLTQMANHTHGY